MARTKPTVGDIFEVPLQNGEKGYVQYIGNDITQLNSDVIRVFRERYSFDDTPDLEEIVKGEVEFYAHVTGMEFGVKDGSWKKVGQSNDLGNLNDPLFRGPGDPVEKREDGKYGLPKVSKSWYIWRINKEHVFVPRLKGKNIDAYPGFVIWPKDIVERMQTGKYHGFYPDYK